MPNKETTFINHEKLRLILLAAVTLCAFGTATGAASAHEYLAGGKPIPEKGHGKIHALVQSHWLLLGTPFGVSFHISCLLRFSMLGGLLPGGKMLATLEWVSCEVVKPSGCTVGSIPAQTKWTLLTASEAEVEAETGTAILTFTLEGASCSLKGSPFKITGTQKCVMPEAGFETELHEIECKTAGSSLKSGGKPAFLEGTAKEVHIVNEKGEATKELYSSI